LRSLASLVLSPSLALGVGVGALQACAKVSGSGGETGGTGNVPTGGKSGTGGAIASTGGKTGTDGTGGAGGAIIQQDKDGGCQQFNVVFEPKIPTVFVLADRSGSMFHPLTPSDPNSPTAWSSLRDGVLSVVSSLQDQVRFGFGAFTGEIGQTCPMFDKVTVISAADFMDTAKRMAKYDEIAKLYNSLKAPTKGETPTMVTLEMVKDLLVADKAPGDKYVLYVTDGEPDFCDDGNAVCPVDSVVWALQDLKASQITTFVFGIKAMASTISDASLQGFANAGAGMPVASPMQGTQTIKPSDIYDQCAGVMPWKDQATKIGRMTHESLGTYDTVGGTAPVFRPDPTDKAALVNQLANVVAGVKSCDFDLSGHIKVDLSDATQLDGAKVLIEGAAQPHSDANGWKMNSETQLELTGSACDLWRKPATKNIDFQFPCQIIIPG
jgi:hypothetical protein